MITNTIAYTPFLDPLNIESWWYFTLVPLAFFVSVAYKAIRVHTFEHYWRNVLIMTTQIVFSIVGLGVLMFVLITQVMPRIAAR